MPVCQGLFQYEQPLITTMSQTLKRFIDTYVRRAYRDPDEVGALIARLAVQKNPRFPQHHRGLCKDALLDRPSHPFRILCVGRDTHIFTERKKPMLEIASFVQRCAIVQKDPDL